MAYLQLQASKIFARYRRSNLLQSGTWYLGAAVLQRGLGFLSVLVLTRLLTTGEYGSFAIYTSWGLVFAIIITLNVSSSVSRAKFDYDEATFREYTSAVLALGVSAGLIASVIVLLLPDAVIAALFALPKSYILLAALSTTAELSVNTTLAVWLVEYKYQWRSLVMVLIAAAEVVLPVIMIVLPIPLFATDKALAAIVGISVVSFASGLFFLYRRMAAGAKLVFYNAWSYALKYALPLIPHALSGLILAQFDRVLIDRYIGRSQAGLYSFAYQLGEITYMIWIATNSAWVPWFFEKMTQKNYAVIRQRANQYLLGFTAITIAAILAGSFLVQIFGPPDFWQTRAIVPVIIGSQFFLLLYSFYANVEFFVKKTFYISIGTALAAAINVVLNIVLLPIYGYEVASWTTFVAYASLFFFHVIIVRYRLKMSIFNFPLMMLTGAVVVVLSIAVYLVLHV